ncbi:basic salivary proline-rich protein 1-like [Trachinotus anak]|uniref:basic salivary proline-rich protein 1-like n=1 Tax=Trachinotus anak TaxID=443729 RepID=UPI0039F2581A
MPLRQPRARPKGEPAREYRVNPQRRPVEGRNPQSQDAATYPSASRTQSRMAPATEGPPIPPAESPPRTEEAQTPQPLPPQQERPQPTAAARYSGPSDPAGQMGEGGRTESPPPCWEAKPVWIENSRGKRRPPTPSRATRDIPAVDLLPHGRLPAQSTRHQRQIDGGGPSSHPLPTLRLVWVQSVYVWVCGSNKGRQGIHPPTGARSPTGPNTFSIPAPPSQQGAKPGCPEMPSGGPSGRAATRLRASRRGTDPPRMARPQSGAQDGTSRPTDEQGAGPAKQVDPHTPPPQHPPQAGRQPPTTHHSRHGPTPLGGQAWAGTGTPRPREPARGPSRQGPGPKTHQRQCSSTDRAQGPPPPSEPDTQPPRDSAHRKDSSCPQ